MYMKNDHILPVFIRCHVSLGLSVIPPYPLVSSALTAIIESRYRIKRGLLPQQGGLSRDTHCAECSLSAAPIREGVNAETTAYAKLGGWDGQYFSCNPLIVCLAR